GRVGQGWPRVAGRPRPSLHAPGRDRGPGRRDDHRDDGRRRPPDEAGLTGTRSCFINPPGVWCGPGGNTRRGYREEAEMETVYTVKGMTCGHCVNAVSAEIGKL